MILSRSKVINFDFNYFLFINLIIIFLAWVTEEGPVGSHVAYVTAEDIDSGKNGETRIRLVSHRDIFELKDGILQTKKKLDREEVSQYKLELEACDSGKSQK